MITHEDEARALSEYNRRLEAERSGLLDRLQVSIFVAAAGWTVACVAMWLALVFWMLR